MEAASPSRLGDRTWAIVLGALLLLVHGQLVRGTLAGDARRGDLGVQHAGELDPLAHLRGLHAPLAGAALRDDAWRPLASYLFAVQKAVFGAAAWAYHLVSLLCMALLAAGLFGLVRAECGSGRLVAATAVLAVTLHPTAVEGLAWMPAQGTLAAATLLVGALAAWRRAGRAATLGGSLLLGAALLCDPVALVFPAWYALTARRPGRVGTTARRVRILVSLALGVAMLCASAVVPPEAGPVAAAPGAGGLRSVFAGMATYAAWWVAPHGFPFDAPLDLPASLGAPLLVWGAALLASALLAGGVGWRRGPRWLALGAWGLVAGVVLVAAGARPAERLAAEYLMLVLVPPLAVLLGGGLAAVPRPALRIVGPACAVLLVAATTASVARARTWRDELTLWSAVQADRPEHDGASLAIARELARRGDLRGAWVAMGHAVEARPLDASLRVEVGDLLGRMQAAGGAAAALGLDGRRGLQVQAAAYQEALDLWARRAGAGDAAEAGQQAYALAQLFELGLGLGDLDLARTSLVLRLRRAWPDAEDASAAFAAAGWPAQADLLRLAFRALQPPPEGASPPAHAAARERALALAGFDARQPGAELLTPWVEAMEAVREAMERDATRARSAAVYLDLARAHAALGSAARAEAMRRAAAALVGPAGP